MTEIFDQWFDENIPVKTECLADKGFRHWMFIVFKEFYMRTKGSVDLNEIDGDGQISLEELRLLIPKLQEKYGKDALVSFDAGYNNVSAMILPKKE
jgi:hypothetical protein